MLLCCLFLVSEFRLRFILRVFILFLVRFRLLNDHLLGNSCSLGDHILFCILTVCNISGYFPFWFGGLDLGSDCFGSWSLHDFYF